MDHKPNVSEPKQVELVLDRIRSALAGLEYGTIQVTVHNSRVVQIDRLERVRILPDEVQASGSGI